MVLRKWLSSFSRQLSGQQKPVARRAKLNQSQRVDQQAAAQLELLETRQLLTAPTDQTAPTPVLSTSMSSPTNASTLPITINFGEDVTGLTLSDFSITNGTASNLTGSGSIYSIDVTPAADGVVTINLPQHSVEDLAGNKSKAATALSITVDRVAPALPTISSPNSTMLTNAANVTIVGSAESGSLVKLYRDADGSGTVNAGDTLMNSQQLSSGQTAFSMSAALSANAVNRLLVTATDAAGNVSSARSVPTITHDSIAPTPTVSVSAGAYSNASSVAVSVSFSETVAGFTAGDVSVGNATLSDFVAVDSSHYTFNVSPNSDGTVTVNIAAGAASDAAGNLSTAATQASFVSDRTAPVITINPSVAKNANGWNNTDVTVSYSVVEANVDALLSDSAADVLTASGTVGATVTDLAGNSTTVSYSTLIDKIAPTLAAFRDIAANANGWNNSDVTVTFEASDDNSGGFSTPATQVFGEGADQTATATVTDLAGNSTSVSIEHINVDKTAPTLIAARSAEANANGWNNTDVTISFEASDALSGGVSNPAGQTFGEGADQSISASVTDLAGNTTSVSVEHINIDKTAPTLTATRSVAANANGWSNSDVTVTFEASDNLSGGFDTPAAQVFGEGVDQTASATVTDLAGNSTSVSIEHISVDKTAPVITATPSVEKNANGWNNMDVTVSYEVFEDNIDAPLSDYAADLLTESGTAEATVTDLAGNTTSVSYSTLIDKVAPTLTASRDIAANANGWNNSDVTVTFEASDELSGGVTSPETQVFGEGFDQTATATVTDLAGNSTTVSIEHINVDKTAPTLTAIRDIAANANGWNNSDVTVTFEASDALSGGVTSPAAQVFGEGFDQTATATVTDLAGNSTTVSIEHINVDETAPTLLVNRSVAANENGWNNTDVTVSFEASDALSGGVSNPESQTFGEGFDQTASATVTDLAGNSTTVSIEHINVDKTAPALTAARDIAANENGWNNSDVTVTFEASDALSGASTPEAQVFGEGFDQTATATVTDLAGNSTTVSIEHINVDKTAPTLIATADIAANENGWNNSDVTISFEASDALSGGVSNPESQIFGEGFDQTASATVTDLAGNSTTINYLHINVDKTAPTLTAARDIAANENGWNNSDVTVSFEASDALSGVTGNPASQVFGEGFDQTATTTVTDLAGNSTSVSLGNINVDKTTPTLTATRDIAANENGWNNSDVTISFEASDELSGVAGNPESQVFGEGADQTATATVTDLAGNSTSVNLGDINVDKTAPTFEVVSAPTEGEEGSELHFELSLDDLSGISSTSWSTSGSPLTVGSVGLADLNVTPMDNGSYQVALTATDLAGNSSSMTLEFSVTNVDPTANDDSVSLSGEAGDDSISLIYEDDSIEGEGLLDNDTDPAGENDSLSVIGYDETSSAGAAVWVSEDGSFGYDATNSEEIQALNAGDVLLDTFGYQISDGDGGISEATVTIEVHGVNDAPSINDTTPVKLPNIDANDIYDHGVDIQEFILDRIDDVDSNYSVGIAVYGFARGTTAGNWQFSTNDGQSWTTISSIGENNAVHLAADGHTRVRLLPDGSHAGTARLTMRAWDGSNGIANGAFASIGETCGTSAYSNESLSVRQGVLTAANDTTIAVSDVSETDASGHAGGNVLDNDIDPDTAFPNGVSVRIGSRPEFGTLTAQRNGSFSYMANSELFASLADGEVEFDGFTYSVIDGARSSNAATVTILLVGVNDAPTATTTLGDQVAVQGQHFCLGLPGGLFQDADTGDSLTITATLADGSALPSWLTFSANRLTLRGTPSESDVGHMTLRVTATDTSGASVSTDIGLEVLNVNEAPQVSSTIGEGTAHEDELFSYNINGDGSAFTDADGGDTLTVTATLADGSALPAWLSFDGATLSGTPSNDDVGDHSILFTATDSAGMTASQSFALHVLNTNDAPTAGSMEDVTAYEERDLSLSLANGLFQDVDAGDSLTI